MYFICLIIGVFCVLCFKFRSIFKRILRARHLSKQFIIPKTIPFLGNAHMLLNIKPEQVIYVVQDLINSHSKTMGFWFGPTVFGIFMMDIKYVECVLSSNTLLVKSMEYDLLGNWLCEGLLISRAPKWFKRRKILTSAFHFKILEQFIEIFDRNSRYFVKTLQTTAEKESGIVNMGHWLNLVTLDIICGKLYLAKFCKYICKFFKRQNATIILY